MKGRVVVPRLLVLFASLVAGGCRPALDDDPSRVEGPRILAVRAEPAEAKPNDVVVLHALYTDGTEVISAAEPFAWSFCLTRRALADPSPVDPECLAPDARAIGTKAQAVELLAGSSPSIRAKLPRDACRVFGPDRPVAKAGESAGRAADPDGTGGYFQAGLVRSAHAAATLFEVRIRCGLPSATQELTSELERRYVPNANPELALSDDRGALDDGSELRVRANQAVTLHATWPSCTGVPCGGAESYVSYDPDRREIVERRESMVVTWLTTTGRFERARTGRAEAEAEVASDNTWTAGSTPGGHGTIFVVLRDARGGTSFRSIRVAIE